MPELKDLPQREFEIMDFLWKNGEATVRRIYTELYGRKELAYTTIATLLMRLQNKGYVTAEQRDQAYVFRPVVEREQVVRRKVDDLVQKVLGGDLGPIAAYIAENRALTPEQVKALEEIVAAKEEQDQD